MADLFGERAVLYDQFHEAEFAHAHLAGELLRGYRKESDLIVVVICPQYQEKTWTGLEWKTIRDVIRTRQKREKNEVMLCRFDGLRPEGLDPEPGPGFFELDQKTSWQFAKGILQRLDANEKKKRTRHLHRLYVRWSWYWLAIGILAPLLAWSLYPVSMRAWSILLSAALMGTMGVVANFAAFEFERVAPVFWKVVAALAVACAALLWVTYRQTVVPVEHSAYVTGSTTVPASKSPDCGCQAGSSAAECARGAPSDEAMDACFGANRILLAKALLLLLYLAATSAFVATAVLGRHRQRIADAVPQGSSEQVPRHPEPRRRRGISATNK